MDYAASQNNRVTAIPFSPTMEIKDYMVLGPFVAETGGAFETEYFHERHKVLDIDYLASTCGEAGLVPWLGAAAQNDYWGASTLRWAHEPAGARGDADLRGGRDGNFGEELFVTEQRNCVKYAAVYIDCEEDSRAIINYLTSGCYLYLNGKRIDKQTYGYVKGLQVQGNAVAVTFHKGRNLLMFKLRVGYICDRLDLSIHQASIHPVAASAGGVGITYPIPMGAYFGTQEEPRQLFPVFVGNFNVQTLQGSTACGGAGAPKGATEGETLSYTAGGFSETIPLPALQPGQVDILRISAPVGSASIDYTLGETAGSFAIATTPWHGVAGIEHEFSDFHFDTTYHQEQRIYAVGALHITAMMMQRLREDPNFKAILSEVDYLHPFYSMYPTYREDLRRMFLAGRAEADCFYNQPNDLTSSGEGFVRNLIYGQLYHRDVLGRIVPVYAPGDVFGHPNQMSQICRKGGCTSASWGKHVLGLDNLFHHVSPDGEAIIHNKHISKEDAQRLGVGHFTRASWAGKGLETYPRSGNTDWMKDTINKAQFSVFSEMMDGIIADDARQVEQDGITKLEYTARDITSHHPGVLLTRTDFKQANRLAENLLVTAEKFSAIAALHGATYPEKALDKAWRQILCAQHHDSITGTNNEISFVDLMIEYREAVEIAAEIVDNTIAFLASGVSHSEAAPVFVFNPLTHPRKDCCEVMLPAYAKTGYALFDEHGTEHPFSVLSEHGEHLRAVFTADVPALGYALFNLKTTQGSTACGEANVDCTIENEFFRVTVDPAQGGGITSIYDKTNAREVINTTIDGPANQIQVLREVPDRAEEQHEFYTTGQKLQARDYPAEVRCEKTAAYEKLYISAKLGIVAQARQEITLYPGVQRIDCKTIIDDYQGRDDLFTLTFPVHSAGGKPVYEDRFALHVCCASHRKLSFQSHQYNYFSHCNIMPAVNWMGLSPTVKLDLGGADINVGMTALIRAEQKELILAGDRLLKALAKKAIPVTPYGPDTSRRYAKHIHFNEDLRNTDTRFVLCVDGVANRYEDKLLGKLDAALLAQFNAQLAQHGRSVLFTRDSDNVWGKPIDVVLIKALNVDALNNWLVGMEKQLATGTTIDMQAILAVDPGCTSDFGVAIFNKGTIACSVEPGNMLNMMLFHTANFYGNKGKVTGGEQMIPEQKSHCFTYAICPHAGDYRQAKLFTRANEFNNELLATSGVQPSENAVLPPRKSFVQVDENFVVTSLKAAGYPLARMEKHHGDVHTRGLTLRGFECNGEDSTAQVQFGFDIASVQPTDLLDENASDVAAEKRGFTAVLPAHSIETYAIGVTESLPNIGMAQLGRTAEPVQPVYIRAWEHDLGTMPMGYLAVAAGIDRHVVHIDEISDEFTLFVCNNQPDAAAQGTVRLLLPEGFAADATEFAYDVAPRGMQQFTVRVRKPAADAQGIMRLRFCDDGQQFEDIYEFGPFVPSVELRIEGEQCIATVHNNTAEQLHGELSLATPYETWRYGLHNREALGNAGPMTCKVDVPPGDRADYTFAVDAPADLAYWVAVKLMVNGRIFFAYADKRGPRPNLFSADMRAKYDADDGSIMAMLTL
ncbi:MAG: hypothetical protein FWB76_03240 [Oscillospiraceae bacterium]|nr:hypothetical protein [Oscillospiraceae bacterium]